jgi:hypothetical protein
MSHQTFIAMVVMLFLMPMALRWCFRREDESMKWKFYPVSGWLKYLTIGWKIAAAVVAILSILELVSDWAFFSVVFVLVIGAECHNIYVFHRSKGQLNGG